MKKIVLGLTLLIAPLVAAAQQTQVTYTGGVTNADTLFAKINSLLNAIIPILISVAVVYLIGAIVYYLIAGDEEKKKVGKSMVGYGILGLFIILSIWGLVNILVRTFGLNNSVDQNQIPSVLPVNQVVGGR